MMDSALQMMNSVLKTMTFVLQMMNKKVLNFSIAYGKTAFGLAKDFDVSTEEAQATVDAWYCELQYQCQLFVERSC